MIWEIRDSCLVFLPLSFAFLLGSFATLRVWLAVQKTLTTVKTGVQKENSVNEDVSKMRTFAYLIAFSIVALGYLAFGVASFDWIARGLFLFLSVPLFFMSSFILLGFPFALHYLSDGDPRMYPRFKYHTLSVWRKVLMFAIIILSISLPAVTLWYHSHVGMSIVVFMMSYLMQNIPIPEATSMRGRIIGLIVTEALFAFIGCVTFTAKIDNMASEKQIREPLLIAQNEAFINWISVPLTALPLFFIIPLSLRLDFSNHIGSIEARQDVQEDLIPLEVVPAPKDEPPMKQLIAGVVIPSSIPFTFKCPYFISTQLTWLLSNVAVMLLLARGWLPDVNRFDYLLYVIVCALPMVILSVFAVSFMRGESKRMWEYQERWSLEPVVEKAGKISETVEEPVDIKEESISQLV